MSQRVSLADLELRAGPQLQGWVDQVVPSSVTRVGDNRYSPRYAWMFSYEKTLKYRLEEALGAPLGGDERLLFGADGVLSEALSNAFVHGHRGDASLAIEVAVGIVENGLRLSIRDQGPGFDVESALERLESGRSYFRIAGNGVRSLLARPEVFVAWGHGGRDVHLLVTGVGRARPRR